MKTEEFIKQCTKYGSNTFVEAEDRPCGEIRTFSRPWLSPEDAIIAVELAKQEAMKEVEAYLNELIEKNSGKSYSDTFLPPLYSVLGFIKSKTKKEG